MEVTNMDTISRNIIVSETNKNFFVEAGAGSGKTTMLVSRMVAMVETGIPIDKICAITFTKAAAGEFYERFQKMLIERSNPEFVWEDKGFAGQLGAPTDETRERCQKALINIDLCFMGTIDSFCNMILSEHPTEAGIPSDATILSDMDMQALYSQMYARICDGKSARNLTDYSKTFRSMFWEDKEVFMKGMDIFMNNRNVHFNYNECEAVDIDKKYASIKAELVNALALLKDHPELQYDGNQGSRDGWKNLSKSLYTLRKKWSNDLQSVILALKNIKGLSILPSAYEKYELTLSNVFEQAGKTGKSLILNVCSEDGLYDELQTLRYDMAMTFLMKCVPVIEQEMREKGSLSYFDYLFYLRNMLKKDAAEEGKLIRYIYNRHSYFLIDEFQDTNPMQAEVFFYLASEKPVENWQDCKPRDGSLFIVGDPKQSIYRFRSADVTSFLNVKRLFTEGVGEILYLSRNFRSTKMLCSYFNRVFTEMLPEENINQSKYEEIPLPEKDSGDFTGVYKYAAYTGQAAFTYPEQTDPKMIGKIIETIVDNDKYLITTKEDLVPRKIKFNDIMVITYGKKKLSPIMKELDSLSIPTKVEGDVPFADNEALIAVSQIYGSVADSSNKIALYGALTGKVLGYSKEALLQYRKACGKLSLNSESIIEETDDKYVRRIKESINDIKDLSEKALSLSPAALFMHIMDTYEVYKYVDSDNMEVLYYTLELLRNAEKAGLIVSLADGYDYITKLLSGESGEERCLSLNDNKDCVHMANLHKVKGLEAPVVILAAASAKSVGATIRVEHNNSDAQGYIIKLEGERNSKGIAPAYFETKTFGDQKSLEDVALKCEAQRLIYVGATRARNVLILCESKYIRKDAEIVDSKWKPIIEAGTPDLFMELSRELPRKIEVAQKADAEKLYKQSKKESVLNSRDNEKESYINKKPSEIKISSKLSDEAIESDEITEKAEMSNVHRFPTVLGTMIHRLMEVTVKTNGALDTKQVVKEIVSEYITSKTKVCESQFEEALEKVSETIKNGGFVQQNNAPKDILEEISGSCEFYCEVPFCYKDEKENVLWNGVIDLIYKKADQWHIIDYKTNLDGNNLDEKYKEQLEAYKNAVFNITGEEVKDALIYHIDV